MKGYKKIIMFKIYFCACMSDREKSIFCSLGLESGMMNAENFFVAGGANSNRVISQVSASISFSETCQFGIQTLKSCFP